MGVVIISSHLYCSFPLRERTPHALLLLDLGVSLMGVFNMNFSNVTASHALQFFMNSIQYGSLPFSAALQEQTALVWIFCRVASPAGKPTPAWTSLSMGPQALPGACSRVGFPWGHSLLQASTWSSVGSSKGCRWSSTPPWTSMGCKRTASLTRVCTRIWKGISALVPGAPPPPTSPTPVCAELTYIITVLVKLPLNSNFPPFFTLLSHTPYHYCWWAWPWPEQVHLGAGIGLSGHKGSLWQLLTEPPLWTSCYQNLALQTQ